LLDPAALLDCAAAVDAVASSRTADRRRRRIAEFSLAIKHKTRGEPGAFQRGEPACGHASAGAGPAPLGLMLAEWAQRNEKEGKRRLDGCLGLVCEPA
jgi:hypothetical protein